MKPTKEEFEEYYNNNTITQTARHFGVTKYKLNTWWHEFQPPRKCNRWKNYVDYQPTKEQSDVILGSMLGDGSLTKKYGNKNSKFIESHCLLQKDYLQYKYNVLTPLSSKIINIENYCISHDYTGKIIRDYSRKSLSYGLETISHPIFTKLEKEWYKRDANGNYILNEIGRRIKIVPKDLILTAKMICIWYCDDGSFKTTTNGDIIFSTQGFEFNECCLLAEKLNLFNIKTVIRNRKDNPIIAVKQQSFSDFMELIKPHIPCESLKYKWVNPEEIIRYVRKNKSDKTLPPGITARNSKYVVTISKKINKLEHIRLGSFIDLEEAITTRKIAEKLKANGLWGKQEMKDAVTREKSLLNNPL